MREKSIALAFSTLLVASVSATNGASDGDRAETGAAQTDGAPPCIVTEIAKSGEGE